MESKHTVTAISAIVQKKMQHYMINTSTWKVNKVVIDIHTRIEHLLFIAINW